MEANVRDVALKFEAVKVSMSQTKDGIILRLAVHPHDCPPDLHLDWVGSRYMVAMVKLNDQDEIDTTNASIKGEKLFKQFSAICRDDDFVNFFKNIIADSDQTLSEKEIANSIKEHLDIPSRTELKKNIKVQKKFEELLEGFYLWKKNQENKNSI
tara:strand:+ start:2131 stop:2595 length:465 start_codon:yes stop_codon:yes gene_type:complete